MVSARAARAAAIAGLWRLLLLPLGSSSSSRARGLLAAAELRLRSAILSVWFALPLPRRVKFGLLSLALPLPAPLAPLALPLPAPLAPPAPPCLLVQIVEPLAKLLN